MPARLRVLVGAVVCAGTYGLVLALGQTDALHPRFGQLVLGLWVVCLVTTWWMRRHEFSWRKPVLVVMAVAALVQLPGILLDPRSSSDAYRYVWDGRVQLSGTSPYRYAPLDDRLARLRDPVLFPGLGPRDRSGFTTAPLPTDRSALLALARDDPRTRINRPRVPTIYPPVAQAWFTVVAAVTPWSLGTRGLQVGSAAIAVLLAGALALWRRRRGEDPLGALWWACCPTVMIEAGNGGHVDIVAAALVVAGLWIFTTAAGRRVAVVGGGLLLGLAASVKLTPLVMLPAMAPLRGTGVLDRARRALPAPAVAVATLAVSYLPHVFVAGALVLGYLPGYLAEEDDAGRAAVLGLLLPDAWLTPAIVVVMAVTVGWALWWVSRAAARREDAVLVALVLFGVLLLATTPNYPWYALPLVALAVVNSRLEWLAVAVAAYLAYGATTSPPVAGFAYGSAGLVVVVVSLVRVRHPRRPFLRDAPHDAQSVRP
ncbi:MAG: glycosyltransferase 87 family protein [Terracoccus sp.]